MVRLGDVDVIDALMDIFASSTRARFNFKEALTYRLLGQDKVDGVLISSRSALKFAEHGKLKRTLQQQRFVKELVFDGIALGDVGLINIMSYLLLLPSTSNIESLSFVGCNIGKGGMLAIAQFMKYPESHRIKRLNLNNNPMGGAGDLEILATALQTHHSRNFELIVSNIGLNSVADRAAIKAILHTPGIVKLNLANNKLNQEVCLQIISQLNMNKDLRELDLTGNNSIIVEILQTLAVALQDNTTLTKLQLPNICNADGVLLETLPSTAYEVSCMHDAQEEIGRIIHRNLASALRWVLVEESSAVEHKGSEAGLPGEEGSESLTRAVLDTAVAPVVLSGTDDDKASAFVTKRRAATDAKELLGPSDSLDDATAGDDVVVREEPSSALANCWHAIVKRCCQRRRTAARQSC